MFAPPMKPTAYSRSQPSARRRTAERAPSNTLVEVFDTHFLELLLFRWQKMLGLASFSSGRFVADRDAVRRECLSLLPNRLDGCVVPLARFPIERFCTEFTILLRERVHENIQLNLGTTVSACNGRTRRRGGDAPATCAVQLANIAHTVHAVLLFRTGERFTELQVVLGFCQNAATGHFFSKPLLSAEDVSYAFANALWRTRCLALDRSLFYLLLVSLATLLKDLLDGLSDEASRIMNTAPLEWY